MSPSAPPAVTSGHFVQVAPDVRLHYASCGAPGAPLMVFLHGFPEFWYAWRALLPAFGDRFHAVAPDLRGYNLSDKPADVRAYRASALVGDIDALVRGLGHERCVLVAHDWGGAAAWSYAIAHPQRVAKLVILNSPHPVPFARALAHDAAQQAASQYMNWLRRPGSEAVLARDGFARLDEFFLRLGGAAWFHGEVRGAYHAAWAQPGAIAGGVNYYRASPLYPPVGDDPGAARLALAEDDFVVRAKTLVIWGDGDTALLPVLLDGLDRLVPDLRIVRLADATHWLVHEQPQRIIREISGFVDDAA
jgi:pimeloyl-ACP methyl ester carboxylesterase